MPLELYVPPQPSALNVGVYSCLVARMGNYTRRLRSYPGSRRTRCSPDRPYWRARPFDTAAFPSRNGHPGGRGAECRNGRFPAAGGFAPTRRPLRQAERQSPRCAPLAISMPTLHAGALPSSPQMRASRTAEFAPLRLADRTTRSTVATAIKTADRELRKSSGATSSSVTTASMADGKSR